MSGGRFNYDQRRIDNIAQDIEDVIYHNDDMELDRWGDCIGYGFKLETIEKFIAAVKVLKRAATMAQRIDWLLSGDDSEESFHKRWDEELKKLEGA